MMEPECNFLMCLTGLIVRLKASARRLNPCGRTSKMLPRGLEKR